MNMDDCGIIRAETVQSRSSEYFVHAEAEAEAEAYDGWMDRLCHTRIQKH